MNLTSLNKISKKKIKVVEDEVEIDILSEEDVEVLLKEELASEIPEGYVISNLEEYESQIEKTNNDKVREEWGRRIKKLPVE